MVVQSCEETTNYCDPPEPYISRIMNMLGYSWDILRNRKVW